MVFFVRITVNQSHLRPICKSTKFNPKIQRTIYLINFQQLRLHVPDFIRTVVIINEKQPTFQYAIEGRLFFLAQKFVLSIIIRIFAASVPTKPLNDAQMRGAFFFYNSSMLKYMAQVCLESAIFDIGITFYTAKIMFLYKP